MVWSAQAQLLGEHAGSVVSLSGLAAIENQPVEKSFAPYLFHDSQLLCTLIFDGQLFNSSIRDASESLPTKITSSIEQFAADALAVFIKFGTQGVLGLDGQFSLALIDQRRKKIILFRSLPAVGELYYARTGSQLIFGSDVVNIAKQSRSPIGINRDWMAHYCAHYSRHSETSPLTGLTTLRPGETHVLNAEKLLFKHQQLIEPPTISHNENNRYYETLWLNELIETVSGSVEVGKRHGIALSGGMDSGAIVAAMKAQSIELGTNLRDQLQIISWSLSSDDPGDETAFIKETADFYKLSLNSMSVGSEYCLADMDPEFIGVDSPFYLPFNALNRHLYRSAADVGVDVLFNGGFGDVLYINHRFILSELWNAGLYRSLLSELGGEVLRTGLSSLRQSPMLRGLFAELTGYISKGGLAVDWVADELKVEFERRVMAKQSLLSCRPQQHHLFTGGFNNDFYGFSRQDAAKFDVELRWPLFNKKLMELALAIPAWTINRAGQQKSITREAIKPYAPLSMVERGRVGLLDELAINGAKNRWPQVLEWLNQSNRIWPNYLNEQKMARIDSSCLTADDVCFATAAVGIELWRTRWQSEGFKLN